MNIIVARGKAGLWAKAGAAAGIYLLVVATTELCAHRLLSYAGAEHIEWLLFLLTTVLVGYLVQRHLAALWRRDRQQREITHWLSALGGDDFFPLLAQNLARSLGANCALICTLSPDGTGNLRSLAAFCHGRHLEAFECSFAGTPAETVLQECRLICLPSGVRERLTAHHLPQGLASDSFLGIPMLNANGRTIGLLALLDDRPLCNRESAGETLQLAAVRAANELERREKEAEINFLNARLQERAFELEAVNQSLTVHQIELETSNDELKQAQQEAMEQRRRYQDLYDFAPVGYFTLDQLGVILETNLAGAKLLGGSRSFVIGHPLVSFLTPDSRQIFWSFCRNVFSQREQEQCEAQLGAPAPGGRWYLIEGVSVLNGEGDRPTCRVAFIDITEHKQAELALRLSENRYRALYRDNPTMIATIDTEWTMLSVNPACAGQLGYSIDELEGQSVLTLFHENDRPAVVEQLWNCLQHPDQVYHWQFRKVRKDGEIVWVEEVAQTVYEPSGALNILVVCQDITERKRAADALKHSEERLRFASTAADIGMWHWDLTGNKLSWSERCKELFGYPPDYPMTYEAFLRPVHEEDRQRIDEAVHKALREKTDYSVEMRVVLPDDRIRWVMSKGRAFYDEQGQPIRMHGITMDITERKQAEEVIERLNADLTARAAELEDTNRELETFNYAVAHDLRKPLTIVNGYCQILKDLCSNELNAQCCGYLEEAYNGTWRMNQLIDTLLKFSQLAHVELHMEPFDFSTLAHEVATELKLLDPERPVTFRIIPGILCNGDTNLLRVVLENLFGNAWKYTKSREKAVVEFGMQELDGQQVYFVRDNGLGFAMTDADKLFIPFKRLPGSEEFKGHGIGLATVERIIRRHGGRVWAEGEPGRGATFYFTVSEG